MGFPTSSQNPPTPFPTYNPTPGGTVCAATCGELLAAYKDSSCCNANLDQETNYLVTNKTDNTNGLNCRALKDAYKNSVCCKSRGGVATQTTATCLSPAPAPTSNPAPAPTSF